MSRSLTEADFRDGLSLTAGMSEKLVGNQDPSRFVPARDFWPSGALGLGDDESGDTVLNTCRAVSGVPRHFFSSAGFSWATGTASTIWYNHVAAPNEPAADCSLSGPEGGINHDSNRYYSLAARSQHPRGVNLLMMDGAVHFARDGMSLRVWRALGSRSGGESTDAGF